MKFVVKKEKKKEIKKKLQSLPRDQNVLLSLRGEIKMNTSAPQSKKMYTRKTKHRTY